MIQLIHGDCLEVMKTLPGKSVDLILTDLPYGTTQNKWDSIIPLDSLWSQYERIIKDNGAIVLHSAQPFTSILISSNLKLFKYVWVWEKSIKTNFLNAKKQPLRQHEDICVFYKKQPIYNPQGIKPVNKFTRQGKSETTNYGAQDRSSGGYFQEIGGYPSDIIKIPSEGKQVHPTQKPVALSEYLISTYTNPGSLVLDSTMGSGTTGVAAKNLGRSFIGIELDEKYFNIAKQRIEGV